MATLHRGSSYALLGLAILHVLLYRRTLVGQVHKWVLGANPAPLRRTSWAHTGGRANCERETRAA